MKKNGKIIMIVIFILFFMLLTWIIPPATYNTGAYVANDINPAGLFDIFVLIYYSLTYKAMDIIFLFMVGGTYGVLSHTKGYRKLVDKIGSSIKKDKIVATIILLVSTLLTGIYASITNEILILFLVAPFLVSIFLKGGKDRLTALSAGFGGMLIGMAGKTFGTYGISELTNNLGLTFSSSILMKLVIFVLVYMLYNLFALLHMYKQNKVDETKYDMFATEKFDVRAKENKRTKVWPFITVSVIAILVAIFAYVSWETSFGVSAFTKLFEAIKGVKIGEQSILVDLLGSVTSFGTWTTMFMNTILLLGVIVLAMFDRMSVNKLILNFQNGVRKIYKVVFIYLLVNCLYVLFYYFPIGVTVINFIIGDGTYNAAKIFLIGFLSLFIAVDFEIIGKAFGSYLATTFASYTSQVGFITYLGMSFAMVIAPTSCLLMIMLTYLDIPYTKWLKYIWKFALAFLWVIIIAILLTSVLA